MVLQGRRSLSDAELLAIIIGSGNRNESAVELARTVLRHFNNDLDAICSSEISHLTKSFQGIGEAKAISILSALELGKRMKLRCNTSEKPLIENSKDLYNAIAPYLHGLNTEEVWSFHINKGNRITQATKICSGGLDASLIDIKLILHKALVELTPAIAIAHNHPSGRVNPSDRDTQSTEKLKKACQSCDIILLDHIIYSDSGYFSFADKGLL